MRQTSTQALNNALMLLQGEGEPKPDISNAIQLIRMVIAMEAPIGKFNIYKWCSTDPMRYVLSGVIYDKGRMVATNTHILVVLAGQDYPKEYEGKIRRRDGQFVEGRMVNYEAVKPKYTNHSARVDFNAVREALRCTNTIRKTENKKAQGICVVGGAWFDVKEFARFITFMEHKGLDTIRTNNENGIERAWIAETGQGDWACIMPLHQGDERNRYFYNCEAI